ncbi:MAG: hypothetical protein AAGM67_02210, partial [Bacteroidota bacterium]
QIGVERVRARSGWLNQEEASILDPQFNYVARVNRLPIERLRYGVPQKQQLSPSPRIQAEISLPEDPESNLYLQLDQNANRADYFLSWIDDSLTLVHRRDRARPILSINQKEQTSPEYLMQRQMIHLAKWENLLNLSNPNSQIETNWLGFDLLQIENDIPLPPSPSGYELDMESDLQVRFQIHNRGPRPLYFGLLYMSADLQVMPLPLEEGMQYLEGGNSALAISGESATISFSRRQLSLDQRDCTDYLKVIASPEPFDPKILEMLDVDRQSERVPLRQINRWTNTHALLFDEVQGLYQDWQTRLVPIRMKYNPDRFKVE